MMDVGFTPSRIISTVIPVAKTIMNEGSSYEIVSPLTWHTITPLRECFTIMVNDIPWEPEVAHVQVRTTKGKDLQKMTEEELKEHFKVFTELL